MTKYVVIYEDEQNNDLAPSLLKGHVEHLRYLYSHEILFLCGPLKNSGGKGLLIFEANSQEEVESCVLEDPFIAQKWYANYHIYEWIEANEGNNFLLDHNE